MLIDTHAHLTDAKYENDVQDVIQRAYTSGVQKIVVNAYDIPSSYAVVELVKEDPNLYATIGVHPHDAKTWTADFEKDFEQFLKEKETHKIVAIGEIGLDYHYDLSPRPMQQELLKKQIQYAYRYDLPVVIHDREAHADVLDILHEAKKNNYLRSQPGVFHCYSGSVEFAKELIKLNFMFGFDGPITFKNAIHPIEALQSIPKDRIVLETDSPYLAPVPLRGKRNEPAYLQYVAEKLAQIWDTSVEVVAEQTTANAKKLFNLN